MPIIVPEVNRKGLGSMRKYYISKAQATIFFGEKLTKLTN
jgi:hypothetical protein